MPKHHILQINCQKLADVIITETLSPVVQLSPTSASDAKIIKQSSFIKKLMPFIMLTSSKFISLL